MKAIHYAFPYVFTLYYKRFISRSFSTFLLFPSRLLKFYNLQRKGSESLGSRSLCMHVCIYLVFISRYKPSALLSFLSSSSTFYNLEKERYQSVLEAFHCTCTYTFILHCKRFNSLFSLILSSRFLFPSFFSAKVLQFRGRRIWASLERSAGTGAEVRKSLISVPL